MENIAIHGECMRNHAAKLGSYATDGCGEYSPCDGGVAAPDLCAACGCHRSYHRRVDVQLPTSNGNSDFPHTSLRRMKQLARLKQQPPDQVGGGEDRRRQKKKKKSKFTAEQRKAMREFAESLGWTLRDKRGRQEEIRLFCDGIGVPRYLFKTWVNNNKRFSSTMFNE